MTILLTGFDPFGGEAINPAWEAVSRIPDHVNGHRIVKVQVPTEFESAASVVLEARDACGADAILCVGQAGGRSAISVERVAINLADGRIPDNAGYQPVDQPLFEDGPAAYFSTVPVKAMVAAIQHEGIPAVVSYTAGTYVCNALLYQLLRRLALRRCMPIPTGFIHIPYAPEQVVNKPSGTPSMAIDTVVQALMAALSVFG